MHEFIAHVRRSLFSPTDTAPTETNAGQSILDPAPEAPPETRDDDPTDRRGTGEAPGDLPAPPRRIGSKADFTVATGFTPEEYVIRALDASDGHLEQPAIVELVGLSEYTLSRILCEMETRGQITRIRIGRRNVVCLPDATPDLGTDPAEVPTSEN